MHSPTTQELALAHTDALKDIVLQAGKICRSITRNLRCRPSRMNHHSPKLIWQHQVIVVGLQQLTRIPIISEESELPAFSERSQWQRYWLVDPLDGTKSLLVAMVNLRSTSR